MELGINNNYANTRYSIYNSRTLKNSTITPSFKGKYETFLKKYNENLGNVPLVETVQNTINNQHLLIGEGVSKKGYNILGLPDYIIRVYKQSFCIQDLAQGFAKPLKTIQNNLDEVVLSIPNKIDIVKRKIGVAMGVEHYSGRIHARTPQFMQNITVTREETLNALTMYEQLMDFPISSYKNAYAQIKKFHNNIGYQVDIISPNNILVDTKSKKINVIDPMDPHVNSKVYGPDFNAKKFHGADSLYPILCDFLMQKEHFENLTSDEKTRWIKAINKIITKCIRAGEETGLSRNIEGLNYLYKNMDRVFNANGEMHKRFETFLNYYINSIKVCM